MEVPGVETKRLAGRQLDQVEQQRHRDARLARISRIEIDHPAGLGKVNPPARLDDGNRIETAAVEVNDDGPNPAFGGDPLGERVKTKRTEQTRGRVDRAHPTERDERGQREQELRLRIRIPEHPGLEPPPRALGLGMGLHR